MRYKTKTIPLVQLQVGPRGVVNPLCTDCKTQDCSYQIETKKVSIFGVTKEHRIMMKTNEPHAVVMCEGYSQEI